MKINVGDKIYIPTEKRPFKVRACDDRYIICTKAYNPKRTYRYFIIDLVEGIRGPDNIAIALGGYETDEDCNERLLELQHGDLEISWRRRVKCTEEDFIVKTCV